MKDFLKELKCVIYRESSIKDISEEEFLISSNSDLIRKYIKNPYVELLKYILPLICICSFLYKVVDVDATTISYIAISALFILIGSDKSIYRKLFEELRLRGVYGLLKGLVDVCVMLSVFRNINVHKFIKTPHFCVLMLGLAEVIDNHGFDLKNISKDNIREILEEAVNNITEINFNNYSIVLQKNKRKFKTAIEDLIDILSYNKFKEINEWK